MDVELTNERRKAYAEVVEVLNHMNSNYVAKIPKELLEFFENEKDKNYNYKMIQGVKLKEQNLMGKTLAILAILDLYYWCENENHKQELAKIFKEVDDVIVTKTVDNQVDFLPQSIFKNVEETKQTGKLVKEKQLVNYNDNIIKKLLNKIKNFFKR